MADDLLDFVEGQGWITSIQADKVRLAVEREVRLGEHIPSSTVLVRDGYLTENQLRRAERALRGGDIQIPGVEIIAPIGKGAFGVVYKAQQTGIDRLVAVKIMDPECARDPEFVERFLREIHAVAQLNHENLVTAMNAGESDGRYYLIMEYVEGRSLLDILRERKKLSPDEVISMARQVTRALAYVHDLGLIHRDVKPANILIKPDGTAKLCDLGLARFSDRNATRLTHLGSTLGTPHYMAPEQLKDGRDADGRADLYSLGIIMYESLVGEAPFESENTAMILAKALSLPVPGIRRSRKDVPQVLAAIIDKLTRKKPSRRYPTAAALIQALDAIPRTGRRSAHRRGETPIGKQHSLMKPQAANPVHPVEKGRVPAKPQVHPHSRAARAPLRRRLLKSAFHKTGKRDPKRVRPDELLSMRRWLVWSSLAAVATAILLLVVALKLHSGNSKDQAASDNKMSSVPSKSK